MDDEDGSPESQQPNKNTGLVRVSVCGNQRLELEQGYVTGCEREREGAVR